MDKSVKMSMMSSAMPGLPAGSGIKLQKHARAKSLTEPADFVKHFQKQLMKHAHATSSQFLLIICDSAGSLEMQATSAFQGYRDKWITEQVKQEARQIAVSAANEKKVRRRRDSGIDKKATQQDKVQVVQHEEEEEEDGWGDEEHEQTMSQDHTAHDSTASKKRKPNPRDRRGSSASEFDGISQDYQQLAIGDRDAVTTFYMTRLRQMQQLMCKVVAKAWIKVIEPKKQSNFPYNRGDESKPNWWPADVRHKEPDHLMKPERLTLLLTMLRSRRVTISKLEAATAEVMVQIPKERIPLLEEIYHVARQEERYDRRELPPDTFIFVAASEKIIRSPPRKPSPQLRRKSIASPIRRDSGSDNNRSLADRRMSAVHGIQTPSECDMVDITDEGSMVDMRVPSSRMEGRDENGGGGYATSFVSQPALQQTSPMQDQPQYMPELSIRSGMSDFYMVSAPSQGPVLRRGNTMPSIPQSSGAPVHHPWMFNQYPPSSTPNHTPYGPPRQSGSNPPTPVSGGPFQPVQLPPPPPNHQHTQLGHRPSHHNLGGDGSGGGGGSHQQYDSSVSMNAQMGASHPHTSALGFTEFLRSELPNEDGNGRVGKME